jgi:murein DD-endopeptidase MepM/ murein hydrolase activator NlpD
MRNLPGRSFCVGIALIALAAGGVFALDGPDQLSGIRLAWPLPDGVGRVVQGFGLDVGRDSGPLTMHDAVNIAALPGTPVLCPFPGRVVSAGFDPIQRSGGFVIIEHLDGGMFTAYRYLRTVTAAEGQRIRQGQEIGTIGATGAVDEPQLEMRVFAGDVIVDPLYLMRDSMPDAVRDWYGSR